ncbi:MAG: SurA N-terminal domain-containing protein [Lunatimonas sp.]|uniref:peptidylprolyl isomerase n=1 Tax=Lunatimonas sp. TaxID=2060141 RepID=UPI00263AFD81|nr:peptidylprolyl isomerase [Lunatimonas sp.]MCC5938416.1 SurA N-terminal domain-containing protein [Lunatimonas sp.]
MALIKEIRQRTGLAIGVIAVGLIFFLVGGDILGPNSMILGSGRTTVGEIAGDRISYEEYIQKIEEAKLSFQQNTGRNPSENELYSIREQAWQALIVEKVFSAEYEKLGLIISDDELVDMVSGKNIIAELRRELTNPQTGEFDRQQLYAFLQSLDNADPQQQRFWAQQERLFADSRLRIKYDNLLGFSEYANTAEARLQHRMANTIAEVDHVHIPYYVISDTAVSVSENELKSFISKNKERFKVNESRDIDYVTFSLRPSAEDSMAVLTEIRALTEQLKASEDDSVFVLRNSEVSNSFRTILPGDNLPANLTSNVENPESGMVYGPFLTERSSYVSYKVTEQFEGTPRMRASHILLSTDGLEGTAKAEVRAEAQRILDEIKGGENFFFAAQQYGQDGTAQRGGDLGWFAKEDFIDEFADAVFSARTTGLLPNLVETEYGYHIIEVTELPQTLTTKLAILELELIASDATRNDVFRNADMFAANSSNAKSFRENAEKEDYQVLKATGVGSSARSLNNLTGAREIIRWSFTEASVGKVSQVFELDDAYVVALLVAETGEGVADLRDPMTREQVTMEVRNEKKADLIIQQIKGLESLEAIKEKFPDASLGSTPDLRMNATVIPGVGFAPRAVGAIFGMRTTGTLSQPIKEDIGVIVAKVNNLTPAPEIADFTRYQNEITTNASQRTSYMIMMAMEELADVKDYRYKFF